MRRAGYRWRDGELVGAVRFWTPILVLYVCWLAAAVLIAARWPF